MGFVSRWKKGEERQQKRSERGRDCVIGTIPKFEKKIIVVIFCMCAGVEHKPQVKRYDM